MIYNVGIYGNKIICIFNVVNLQAFNKNITSKVIILYQQLKAIYIFQ